MPLTTDIPQGLDEAINRIGLEALAIAPDDGCSVLFYAEVRPDMEHMILRYALPGEGELRCAEASDRLVDALREAWDICARAAKAWQAMIYVIKDRKLKVELLYQGEVSDKVTMYEKEDALIAKYFPGMEVIPVELPGSVSLSLEPGRPFWKFWR